MVMEIRLGKYTRPDTPTLTFPGKSTYDIPLFSRQRGNLHSSLANLHLQSPPRDLSARTIRRGLQQSGLSVRLLLLGLHLTQNHRHLRHQ
ncbi:hypothetical protein TNCV_2249541 [Trichonephila clavipes]|nr:hypothetical protein TNCV_2249541 [Trichonephila clavipes]